MEPAFFVGGVIFLEDFEKLVKSSNGEVSAGRILGERTSAEVRGQLDFRLGQPGRANPTGWDLPRGTQMSLGV